MNYRHAFHAGNFADLLKHAVLLHLLAALTRKAEPLSVLDTHAGAGAYDLSGEAATRSGEAQAGIARLMAAPDRPPVFAPLIEAVRRLNSGADGPIYPGSPLLAVQALRRGDRYIGCDLQGDDRLHLASLLREQTPRGVEARALQTDGYAEAAQPLRGRRLLLIDPPFERGDDYARIVQALRARGDGPALVWLPLKDLDTFDRFLGAVEAAEAGATTVVEARLQPLNQPLKMNGCALLLVDVPDVSAEARAAAEWIVSTLGRPGGEARLWRLG